MKDIIASALFIISLIGGGSYAVREVHNKIQKAALKKTSNGLPSLTKLTHSLRGESVK